SVPRYLGGAVPLPPRTASRRSFGTFSYRWAAAGDGRSIKVSVLDVQPARSTHAMRWRRAFPGQAEQSRMVRGVGAFLLAGHTAGDDVISVVSEFVANALRHTHSGLSGGFFAVEVRGWRDGITVAVSDQGGPTEPATCEVDELAESGRGLSAVEALASRWEWT